jgi:general secretion pathway protein H
MRVVRSPYRLSRGITLLELLIVIGVIVLMMGVGISGLNNLSSVQLRTQTNRLAAAIRHSYNRAVADGLYVRMALYIDADRYTVEASSTPVFIDKDREQIEDEKSTARRRLDEDDDSPPPPPKFAPLIPDVSMQKGIGIDGVLTSGQVDVFESGVAYIHFFPNGFVEPAMIYTTDGVQDFYTLIINPLTGRVRREGGKVDPDRSFGEPDRVEEEGR